MESHFPFHKITKLENMMMNILCEGKEVIWKLIETTKNPLERCEQRKIYSEAINKINKGK